MLFFYLRRPSKLLGFARCHWDWLVQTAAEATGAEEHETKGLDTDTLVPDAMESDAELQV